MIRIQELLFNRGLNRSERIKLVRHKDPRTDLYNLYRTEKQTFLIYQSQQLKDVFKGVSFIVSFIGEESTRSRFIGVFRVLGMTDHGEVRTSIEGGVYRFQYELEEINNFEDLKERVIVNWLTARAWHQWIANDMEIIEIQPGLHYKQFTDYFDFILTFRELKEIITREYPDWKRMLSATKGIYLISDTKTGKLYIGSAYGEGGIWGRWKSYVLTNGHGNNKALKELINIDKGHSNHFQFSILMLLPSTVTPDEAIKRNIV